MTNSYLEPTIALPRITLECAPPLSLPCVMTHARVLSQETTLNNPLAVTFRAGVVSSFASAIRAGADFWLGKL